MLPGVPPIYQPLDVSGYVLAGGRSSRMGQDKALLELAGKPLVEHAVTKLRRICQDVAILSSNQSSASELERFAPLVEDLHPGCGPLGGIEAALTHANREWSFILPVDVPFPPTWFLRTWVANTQRLGESQGTRVAMFRAGGMPQPTVLLIHRELREYLTRALDDGMYKLFPVLEHVAADLGRRHGSARVLEIFEWGEGATARTETGEFTTPGPDWTRITQAQTAAGDLYFANLNTPEELAKARLRVKVLDT